LPRAAAADAAVVVIAYNSAEVLNACLDSLVGVCAETIVVDNASTDQTAQIARRHVLAGEDLQLIANLHNRGFAGAANDGFRATRSKCVLLLNPDAVLLPPADLSPMVRACEKYGLASGMLVDEHGHPQRGFFARSLPTAASLAFEALGINRLWPSNPANRRYRCLDLRPDVEAFVEQPPGAFLMIRRDVWEALDGFDEAFYPVWFEDTDFCRRALDQGYRIRFLPSCAARHEGGHSVLRVDESDRAVFWYGSLLRYASKHLGAARFRAVCLAVAIGAVGRMVAGLLPAGLQNGSRERRSKTVRMYATIIRLAAMAFVSGKVPSAVLRRPPVVQAVEH
jgi:N-acetylglucosaminyl-diphospho-decaprenol L-rhamnosyltransferase